MWIPTWIVVPVSLYFFVVNYSEAKAGLMQLLLDLGIL